MVVYCFLVLADRGYCKLSILHGLAFTLQMHEGAFKHLTPGVKRVYNSDLVGITTPAMRARLDGSRNMYCKWKANLEDTSLFQDSVTDTVPIKPGDLLTPFLPTRHWSWITELPDPVSKCTDWHVGTYCHTHKAHWWHSGCWNLSHLWPKSTFQIMPNKKVT